MNRIQILRVIQTLNNIIYAEDTTNKLANKLKKARDPLYEIADEIEAKESEPSNIAGE